MLNPKKENDGDNGAPKTSLQYLNDLGIFHKVKKNLGLQKIFNIHNSQPILYTTTLRKT